MSETIRRSGERKVTCMIANRNRGWSKRVVPAGTSLCVSAIVLFGVWAWVTLGSWAQEPKPPAQTPSAVAPAAVSQQPAQPKPMPPGGAPAPAPPTGTPPGAAPTPPPAKPTQPAPPPKKKQLPPPEEVTVRTKEPGGSMELRGTFYPGSNGKDSVPVILLHMWKGSRADFAPLVPVLQDKGHAILVPDLRGHGQSRRRLIATPRGPSVEVLDAEKLAPADFAAMVQFDLEAWKRFLLERNDAEGLNIEKLCVVGAEMGAAVALNWALLDWSWPQYPGVKQGQDVKALVLLSPPWNFRGLDVQRALADPFIRSGMSIMILVGTGESKAAADARRIHGLLEKARPELETLPPAQRNLFFGQLNTSLQGTRLLGVQGLNVEDAIARFIEIRLVKQDFPWRKRLTKAGS
ncbi:MAG: alpha/beta hydrolase [Thermoguttaceae bacterium]|nr:alpha/beta hydrolase [Thermoguttaceae bacterium]MDW8078051.1 alpha/beta fold hydrolase [Thermoguttaceae bacterium]